MSTQSKTTPHTPLVVEILQRVAGEIGAVVQIEPEWGYAGSVVYSSGIRRYFRSSTLDINTMGASDIARDKGYTRHFLMQADFPVAEGRTFLSASWAKKLNTPSRGGIINAWKYAKRLGLPVFVKPNSKSQGTGVAKARTEEEFRLAAKLAFKYDQVIVVEKALTGKDYRVVILDGEVISAYERIPLAITGDGTASIYDLLLFKQRQFVASGRDTIIKFDDPRLRNNLDRMNLTLDSILEDGREIQLLDNANLSSGGMSIDVTERIHPSFKRISAAIAEYMGLRFTGVDLMINGDITQEARAGNYWVIEVNSAPGLDHYASMGDTQRRIVDNLYLKVLVAMERPSEKSIALSKAEPS